MRGGRLKKGQHNCKELSQYRTKVKGILVPRNFKITCFFQLRLFLLPLPTALAIRIRLGASVHLQFTVGRLDGCRRRHSARLWVEEVFYALANLAFARGEFQQHRFFHFFLEGDFGCAQLLPPKNEHSIRGRQTCQSVNKLTQSAVRTSFSLDTTTRPLPPQHYPHA